MFGILAREKVDLAFIWRTPEGTQEVAWQLFRDYDGRGSRFGDVVLPCQAGTDDVAVYAAKRTKDGAVTVVVVNKNLGGSCDFKLELPGVRGKARVYRFDQESNARVVEVPKCGGPTDDGLGLTLPAASATLIEIK